jgi:hypothetical protein
VNSLIHVRSQLLVEIKFKIMKLLPDRYMSTCEAYLSQYQFIAGQLRGLIYRAMCPQLVKANYVSMPCCSLYNLIDSCACADFMSNIRFRSRLGD